MMYVQYLYWECTQLTPTNDFYILTWSIFVPISPPFNAGLIVNTKTRPLSVKVALKNDQA